LSAEKSTPIIQQYTADNRERVFAILREALSSDACARLISQWDWRCDGNPFTASAGGPAAYLLLLDAELVGLADGFRVKMWMGGEVCDGEALGDWLVRPSLRGRNLWQRALAIAPGREVVKAPVLFGWTRLPPRVGIRVGVLDTPLKPLVRILNPGSMLRHLMRSASLKTLGAGAATAARLLSSSLRPRSRIGDGKIIRLSSFDDRIDSLWERARRHDKAMVVREHRYLNWRYRDRPDASYLLYGLERGATLDGFLVARKSVYEGMPWGNLVDFLAAPDDFAALSTLIEAAVDDLRSLGATAVVCYFTDPGVGEALNSLGFLSIDYGDPVRFPLSFSSSRPDLKAFEPLSSWYLTMGDGDLELGP
jgi:hypothetical protein